MNTLIMIHKINKDLTPKYLKENLKRVNETSMYNTRNNEKFRLPMHTKATTQNNLFYKGAKQYNELNKKIKDEKRIHKFKNKLNKWIKENINLYEKIVVKIVKR